MKKGIVTVGIPTYNRPFGLERTLTQICNQTYKNIEILISDNCSSDPAVREILEEYASKDSRIKYVIQPENQGIVANFRYLLNHSDDTEFFMWAADDDEWDSRFIETCVNHIGDNGTAMTGFYRHMRLQGEKDVAHLVKINGKNDPMYARLGLLTYSMPCHSIIYGLHRKTSILEFFNESFDDEYFLFKQMMDHGIVTLPEYVYYVAGIDSDRGYEVKEFDEHHPHKYSHKMLTKHYEFLHSTEELSNLQRLDLMRMFIIFHIEFYILKHKKQYYSDQEKFLAHQLLLFLSKMDINQLENYNFQLFNLKDKFNF